MSGITTVGFRRLLRLGFLAAATLSVLLEPLLMAAAALVMVLLHPVCSTEQPCCPSGIVNARFDYRTHGGSSLVLNKAIVLTDKAVTSSR